MSDSDDVKTELIKGSVEAIKTAYGDALQPSAKQIGKTLETLLRAVNAALLPLEGFVWCWERVAQYVSTTVPQKLAERRIPADRIMTPDPDVAVPALEALRYSKLKENYAILIATSMDTGSVNDAHPAFVEILKQLTPDDVKILEFLPKVGRHEPLVNLGYTVSEELGCFTAQRHVGTLATDAGCEHPEQLPTYVDNLCRLGLTEVPAIYFLVEDWRYEHILSLDLIHKARTEVPEGASFDIQKAMCGLTNLGGSFREACTIPSNTK